MNKESSLSVKFTYSPIRGGKVRCNQNGDILSSKMARSHRRIQTNRELDIIESHGPRKIKRKLPEVIITNSRGRCPNRNCNQFLWAKGEAGPWACPKCGTKYLEIVEKPTTMLPTAKIRYSFGLSDHTNCPVCKSFYPRAKPGEHICLICCNSFTIVE